MNPVDFAFILGQIKGQTDFLALHVLGEPLLHPQLALLLEKCQQETLRVNITTNGTLLKSRMPVLFASSQVIRQINISLHCITDSKVKQCLNPASYLTEVFDFISKAISSTSILINLRLWNITDEKDSAQQHNEYILKELENFFCLPYRLKNELTPGQGIRLHPKVFLSQNRRFVWPHTAETGSNDRGFCRGLRDHVAILVDGTVVPCCFDAEGDIDLGNIYLQPLAEIVTNARASAMRQEFSRRRALEGLCRRCTYKQMFEAAGRPQPIWPPQFNQLAGQYSSESILGGDDQTIAKGGRNST